MNITFLFACGLILTLLVSLGVVGYLNGPLRRQLQQLCGNDERAEFWTVFSNVMVALIPLIFALQFDPMPNSSTPPILVVASQFKLGLLGLAVSILVLGWILSRFIPNSVAVSTAPGAERNSAA